MRMGTRTLAVCAIVVSSRACAAQGRTMRLAEVLARAREQAPQIVSARLAMEEARGRLLGASVRLRPTLNWTLASATETDPTDRFTDFEFGLGQTFEPAPTVGPYRRRQRRDRPEHRQRR